jgi:hypothetical protein
VFYLVWRQVDVAVDFHFELMLDAKKVQDVWTEGMLPPEFQSREPAVTQ